MSRRILLLTTFSLFTIFSFSRIPGQFQYTGDTTDINKRDSILSAVSVLQLPADPKEGFRQLFVTATASNGVKVEQLNPLAVSFVEDYILKFGSSMMDMKGWGKPYFDMMDAVLIGHGLPKELKYLAVIESRLQTQARSWAGAVGPWQFMAGTAKGLGLKVGKNIDERRDMLKSTHAASRYLNSLYAMYGDWLLVIAAYNGGPGKVNTAIRRSGSRDFWVLQKFLPAESRNHVKKFIATHYIMEGEGGITTLTKEEAGLLLAAVTTDKIVETDSLSRTQAISGRYNSSVVIKHILMDIFAFNKVNPNFDKVISETGKYQLRLPADKMELFLSKKSLILSESMQLLLNPEQTAFGVSMK
jgi:membrane-bound lytic murein transglycosylase D